MAGTPPPLNLPMWLFLGAIICFQPARAMSHTGFRYLVEYVGLFGEVRGSFVDENGALYGFRAHSVTYLDQLRELPTDLTKMGNVAHWHMYVKASQARMYHNLNPAEGTGVKTGHGNAANAGTTVAVPVPNETDPSKVRAVTGLLIQTTCELRVTTNQLKEAKQANQVLTDKLATKQQAEMQHKCTVEAIQLATDAIVATAATTERDSTATINDLRATIGTTERAHQASDERLAAMKSAFKKSEIQCAKLASTNAKLAATNESVESLIAANTEAGIVNDEYAAAFEESAAKLAAAAAESAKKIAELTEANAESATKLGESTAASAESAAKLGAATAAFEESAAKLAESDAKLAELTAKLDAAAKAEESKKRVAPGPTRVSKRAKTKNCNK